MGLIPLLVLLAIAEAAAWYLDSRWHFHNELLAAFSQVEISSEPVPVLSQDRLPWPADTIAIRSERDPENGGKKYIVGGRAISNAHARQTVMYPRQQEIGPATRRQIVVVGGSAALGFPYAYGDSFAGKLQQLAGRDDCVVINCAQRAWLSGEVAAVADRAMRFFSPDDLIVMAGNNEWLHWKVNHPELQRTMRGMNLRRVLASSRVLALAQYIALRRAIDQRRVGVSEDNQYQTDHQLIGYHYALRYPLEDIAKFDARGWEETKKRFLDVFQNNLTHIVETAQKRDVRVYLLTLPFNYKLSPAWKHPQPESFDPVSCKQVREAIHTTAGLCDAKKYEQGLRTIDAALALDPYPPIAHYLKGYCLERLAQPLEAETAYAECRERMIGNLGSRLSINRRIHRVARATGATLLDVRRLFDEHNHKTKHYFNVDLIHDDCHPTPAGHTLIAKALGVKLGLVTEAVREEK